MEKKEEKEIKETNKETESKVIKEKKNFNEPQKQYPEKEYND